MSKGSSQLILNVSGNLLGFCLIVITSLHIADIKEGRFLDELMMIVALLLTSASVFSFVSLKHENETVSLRLERWSEYFFFSSLVGILIAVMLITLNYIH